MKNNLWDKKFIEFNIVHDLYHEIGWSTRVHFFFSLSFFFHKFHHFNIELVGNLAFQFFFQDYPYKFHMLTQINLGRSKIFLS